MEQYGSAWAEINFNHLNLNYDHLVSLLKKNTRICCVLKANAYGHGSVELAKFYIKKGADYFAVATLLEAMELRNAGIEHPVVCLGYVPEYQYEILLKNNIDISVYSMNSAKKLSQKAADLGVKANVHIKLDSGMSRLGFQCTDESVEQIERIYQFPNLHFRGIFTHFAKADEKQTDTTREQFARYIKTVDKLEEKGLKFDIRHCCNTAGAVYYPEYHLDMVRFGIALYGYYPSDEVDHTKIELKPAMRFCSIISHLKVLEQGRGVSYGYRYKVCEKEELIATMPLGYADGFTRLLSEKVAVQIDGTMYPVVGSICMDQSMIKLDRNKQYHVGQKVIIYSEEDGMGADRLAKSLGTISYEILCMLQRRILRVYFMDGKVVKVVDYLESK